MNKNRNKSRHLLPTRLCKASKKDNTANLRFHPLDVIAWGLEPGVETKFILKHSDGTLVEVAGRVTQAMDKCYLSGLGKVPRYNYTSPDLADTRPVEIRVALKI